jgi:hypothetical protein
MGPNGQVIGAHSDFLKSGQTFGSDTQIKLEQPHAVKLLNLTRITSPGLQRGMMQVFFSLLHCGRLKARTAPFPAHDLPIQVQFCVSTSTGV